jgi:hypothetical protein
VDDLFLRALDLAHGVEATASAIAKVSAATSPEAARWAFTQWDLRQRALAKFARADEMLFDRDGLEMASHEAVAHYHASKFPHGVQVYEIGAGVGADTMALAARGPVVAFEVDPARASYARHNLALHHRPGSAETKNVAVLEEDGLEAASQAFVYCDPARRAGQQRRLALDAWQPDPRDVVRRFMEGTSPRLLVLKLSPMIRDADLEAITGPAPWGVEFLSFRRECREALVMLGPLANPGVRAVHVESGQSVGSAILEASSPMPLRFISEVDPAAIRAHALGAFGVDGLGDSQGYLTSDEPIPSPFLRHYEVQYAGTGDFRNTQRALRQLQAHVKVVKQRLSNIDPARVVKSLEPAGDRELILLVWPVGKSLRHALVQPLGADPIQIGRSHRHNR